MDARFRFEHIKRRFRSFSDHRCLASNFGSYYISEYDPKAAFPELSQDRERTRGHLTEAKT